jgi:metal-responsive CopG/Arc/MetJ family transcriptional regulator
MDIPDDLLIELEEVRRIYGMRRDELIISAIKRLIDKNKQLYSQAIGKHPKPLKS